jgi:hypothetical protein
MLVNRMNRRHRHQGCNMNFFERRKILKRANYLELTPVRLMDQKIRDDGMVDILMPRFKNKFWREVYRNSKKGEFIYIHLDQLGSAIWQLIDGKRNVTSICSQIINDHPEKIQPVQEAEARVTKFLSRLYQEKYISFIEITYDINTG